MYVYSHTYILQAYVHTYCTYMYINAKIDANIHMYINLLIHTVRTYTATIFLRSPYLLSTLRELLGVSFPYLWTVLSSTWMTMTMTSADQTRRAGSRNASHEFQICGTYSSIYNTYTHIKDTNSINFSKLFSKIFIT